jgi:NADPH:quinone reductase-like Zn-dependent oxidoreductase
LDASIVPVPILPSDFPSGRWAIVPESPAHLESTTRPGRGEAGGLRASAPGPELLLQQGGGGGALALQMAKAHGADVTAVDTAGKLEMLRSLGADEVVDYGQEDFTDRGIPYDLWLGLVLRFLTLMIASSFVKQLRGPGSGWLTKQEVMATLANMFEDGEITPIVEGTFSPSEIREAFRADRNSKGALRGPRTPRYVKRGPEGFRPPAAGLWKRWVSPF